MFDSSIFHQGTYYTATLIKVEPTRLLVEFPRAVIQGLFADPIPDQAELYRKWCAINRVYVNPNSPYYKSIDPDPVYTVNDQVAVLQLWQKEPKQPITYDFQVIGKWRCVSLD